MTPAKKPHLVSFALCPFVRRSVIALLEKGIDFKITHIDLNNKPDWFLKISPLGLVPLLEIEDAVLFESAVINEYLDEVYPPALHPKDPLQKACHRGFIEFGSALLGDLYWLSTTKEKSVFEEKRFACLAKLDRLNQECLSPYFSGNTFSLIDTAFAPALHHMSLLKTHFNVDLLGRFERLQRWNTHLLSRKSVIESVPQNFENLWLGYYKISSAIINLK